MVEYLVHHLDAENHLQKMHENKMYAEKEVPKVSEAVRCAGKHPGNENLYQHTAASNQNLHKHQKLIRNHTLDFLMDIYKHYVPYYRVQKTSKSAINSLAK